MRVQYENTIISDTYVPTNQDMIRYANDPNCKRTFMGKTLEEVVTPDSTFYGVSVGLARPGVFLLDKINKETGAVCMHIVITEGHNRYTALTATKLAAFLARINGLIPYTTVLAEPTYDYMRRFLYDCGFVHHATQEGIDIITIPNNYIPQLPSITIHP